MLTRLHPLICPTHRGPLTRHENGSWQCHEGHQFAERDGVLSILPHTNEFYEGAYLNHIKFTPKSENWFHTWPLWLVRHGYPWMVRKHVASGSRIIELGCAGGVDYFASRYFMIGVDLSIRSLASTANRYAMRIQADASICIPVEDGSIDAVISSFFWEHIEPTVKDQILAECYRVLKPQGKVIFLYDIETNNPLIARYKRKYPDKYKELFLDCDGHVGYESPIENLHHFACAQFDVIEQKYLEQTAIQSSCVYHKLSLFPSRLAKAYGLLDKATTNWFYYPYTAVVRAADTAFGHFLPRHWGRITITVARKNS